MLAERFGWAELWFCLRVSEGALVVESTGAALVLGKLRVSLPRLLSPRIKATVRGATGFCNGLEISVEFALPLVGPVLCYEGYLEPEEERP